MNKTTFGLELLLAALLRYGTWFASAVIGFGLAMVLISPSNMAGMGTQIIGYGVAMFIVLPVLRVLAMMAFFLWERDYRFVIITALVLTTIVAGFVIGMSKSNSETLGH
jgi:uncharacterized membrane protein